LDRVLCLADRVFFSAKPSINYRKIRQIGRIIGVVSDFRFQLLARGCKERHSLFLIAARARNPSVSPILRAMTEGVIRILRRSSSNHPIRRVVISQVEGRREAGEPYPEPRTIL